MSKAQNPELLETKVMSLKQIYCKHVFYFNIKIENVIQSNELIKKIACIKSVREKTHQWEKAAKQNKKQKKKMGKVTKQKKSNEKIEYIDKIYRFRKTLK